LSEESIELIRRIYAAWEEGEIGREFLAEDVEWVNPPDALEPGLREGIEGFTLAMSRVFDVWKEMYVQPDRLFDHGSEVIMIGHIRGRGRQIELSQPHAQVWTVRDGKVVRFRWFSSGEEALKAVGLPPR
jgi:ketosteroid isomerase-like protein